MTAGLDVLYIGGYTSGTGGTGPGLTVARRDGGGVLKTVAQTPAPGPSFLALHPRLPVLYAALEEEAGRVAAFSADPGGPRPLAERSSGGSHPCHVAVAPDGSWLAAANYGDGVLALFRLDEEGLFDGPPLVFPGGGRGPDAERQAGPHAHQATFGPDGVLYLTDLGADEIRRYTLGPEPAPHPGGPVRLTPGCGPRHLARRDGRWHLACELDGTVRVYDERWHEIGHVAASGAPGPNLASHLEFSADGRHLYVANRGPDTIGVFEPGGAAGLTLVAEVSAGVAWPRHFALVDGYLYVAGQRSGTVAALPLLDGVPGPVAETFEVGSPSCVLAPPA
ncbi:beta-propeller fold lactonase family protein [Sphaerisporangium sp. TRM90804]|uniref:lactonase family protein n=1 Tax=Sphaerisporangium sp. TRM90804 TaxID=3031113 RepID=UPI00244CF171|nr:beta-propeller fold lactonase family protein [Sphaerisporangium sp. TRM90804]MDH2424527.1 beta-propeller fold lactonase family protein [Sphaerisporangium sp. TRM90804]